MSRSAMSRELRVAPEAALAWETGLEQYGNQATYNFEPVLLQNIRRSEYYEKYAVTIEDVNTLVDEIYDNVEDVEPWMSGNARGPSTAFNLLYRLCQLRPDTSQIRHMLGHKDSPYIRAIGFLYLRYTMDPKKLWGWIKDYLHDDEVFQPSPKGLGTEVTMGAFVRDIMLDQFYFETIFPRVPKPVHDEIVGHLKEMGLPTVAKGNAGQGGEDRRGVKESTARPASVKASLSVAFGQRAPNRAGVREQGRGMGSELQLDKGGGAERRKQRSASPPPRDDRKTVRADSRDRRRDDSRDRRRDDPRGGDRRREDRDYGRQRDEGVDRRRDDRGHDRRDYDRRDNRGGSGRYDDRDRRRDERDGGRRYDSGRQRYDDREQRRSRSRSRDRQRSGSRDARDVFRERAAPIHANPDKIRETYG